MASFRKNFSSWLWGVVLIIFAVAALVVVGWLGFRNLQKCVWNDARADCEEWADRLEMELRADRLDQLEGRRVVFSSDEKKYAGHTTRPNILESQNGNGSKARWGESVGAGFIVLEVRGGNH